MESTAPTQATTSSRQLLRHTVATVAYRGGKAVRGALESFAAFKDIRRKRSFKAGSLIRSPTSGRSRCCGGWPDVPFVAKIISRPKSSQAAWARSRRLP